MNKYISLEVVKDDQEEKVGLVLSDKRRTKAQALEASIEKWQTIVTLFELGLDTIKEGGPDTCGLCQLYYFDDCIGCPVYEKTGEVFCQGSPYRKFCDSVNTGAKPITIAKNARKELEFLQSLKK